ncbi:MAG: GTP cyclohydrolase II, partial [Novosphingobium sp.]
MRATRRVALALDALRHGWPVEVDGVLRLLPAETGFAPGASSATMLISCARAATLRLGNQRDAVPEAPVVIRGAEPFGLILAAALADPAMDLRHPFKGPFRTEPLGQPAAAATAMELARLAGILPAYLIDPSAGGEAQVVSSSDLAEWSDPRHLHIASRARLPIAAATTAEIAAFRSADDLRE